MDTLNTIPSLLLKMNLNNQGGNEMKQSKLWNVKNVVLMGMFGALAAVLMVFEFPLPFIAPSFYGLDLSEIPVLVGTFSLGPLAGVVIELVKVLVKLLIKPTSTGFVGELANFCFGCAMILPAGWIYICPCAKTARSTTESGPRRRKPPWTR